MNKPASVYFLYGLGEGSAVSRNFRRHLRSAGYAATQNIREADIIITHSGGCLLLPNDITPKLTFHIGYTYWPGRTLLASHWLRQLHGLRTYRLHWIPLNASNIFYLFRLAHTRRLAKLWPTRTDVQRRVRVGSTVFICNQSDSFCNQPAIEELARGATIVHMEGGHDDCWLHPEAYTHLIQSVYG